MHVPESPCRWFSLFQLSLAFFKANAISFEMEDKYEYPRHPVIGAPRAYTRAEMAELTRYALERYIQIIPNVQAPAHMTFVLKHPEFAHLRSELPF